MSKQQLRFILVEFPFLFSLLCCFCRTALSAQTTGIFDLYVSSMFSKQSGKMRILFVAISLFMPAALFSQTAPPGNVLNNPILGEHKVLFIRVQYPDDNEVVLSDARAIPHARDLEEIIERNAYGVVDLKIDVTPVLTMPQPVSYYQGESGFVRIRADAIQMAADAGYAESDYDRDVIFTGKIWPQPWYGYGYMNWRTSFMAADSPLLSAHEVGHSFGWFHATFWRVQGDDPISPEGQQLTYGDGFDIMGDQVGKPRRFHHFNPWFKSRVGWIPPENILTVSAGGTYTIRAIEATPVPGAPDRAFHALKIHRDPQTDYWVFYRSQENLANTGAMIIRVKTTNISPSQLLDMTPASKPLREDYEDAALTVGKTFFDAEAGIEIKLVEKTPDALRVVVVVHRSGGVNTLPVIDVISPARSETVSGEIDYQVTAFDPDVGAFNGAGIDSVKIVLGKFSDDDSTIAFASTELAAPPYTLRLDTRNLTDKAYFLFVTAISADGSSNTIHFQHIIDNTGPSVPTGVDVDNSDLPSTFALFQNYPNPFNPSTSIQYSVGSVQFVSLKIYDVLGREVKTLVQRKMQAGSYEMQWDGRDARGRQVASGVYVYRLQAGDASTSSLNKLGQARQRFVQTRKMLLLQ
jgi:hypothetical protein